MKRNRRTLVCLAICAVLTVGITCLLPEVALAKIESIAGMDQYYGTTEQVGTTVDVLSVVGEENDTVFVEMKQGDRVIASHLAFTLNPDTSEAKEGRYVGVLSVAISDFDPARPYSIAVYDNREQTGSPLYQGTISPVYAQIPGQANRIIAIRTLGSDENRTFNTPGSVTFGGVTYQLASAEPVSTSPLTYAYEANEPAQSVDGHIAYVNDEGQTIKTETIEGIAYGTNKTVSVPSVITTGEGAQSAYWRTVCFGGNVTAAYPGNTEFVIPCKPLTLAEGAGNQGNYYFATIDLVDTEGNRLATDTLNVTGKYNYTAPARLHLTGKDGLVTTYVLGNNEALSDGVLALDPTTDNVTTGSKTYKITYDKLSQDAEATWTILTVNGAEDPKSENREISRETISVKPGETKTFEPAKEIVENGQTLVPTSSTKDKYEFTYGNGDDPMLTVYYVPDGYKAPEPYDVTVRYVNIANNKVLQSHALTVRPQDRDELEITSPKSFTQDGIEYVRLDGQDKSVFHSYYSSNRTYTIYYRDINDDLSANIVITHINTEYVNGATTAPTTTNNGTTTTDGGTTGTTTTDGGTTGTTTDGGTTAIDGGTTTTGAGGDQGAATGAEGDAVAASIPEANDLTVINGADNSLVTDGEGRDTNTMRIEDDTTPLAGPESASGKVSMPVAAAIAGSALAVAVLGGFLFFWLRKRRKNNDETTEESE